MYIDDIICTECGDLADLVNSTPLLNESIWTLPITLTSSIFTATAYTIIFIVAVIFNPLLIVFIVRAKGLHQPSFIFLLCLTVVDFVEAFVSLPFYLAAHVLHGWRFGETDQERQAVCDMLGFFLSIFLGVSIYLLALISFDRFFYIVCAFKYKRYMKPWVAWLLVFSLVSIPLMISALPLFGFDYFYFNPDFGACIFRWRGETAYVVLYSVMAFLPFLFILIFTTITCCYVHQFISGNLKRDKFVMRRQDSKAEERAKQKNLTLLFGLLLVTQLICYMPAFMTAFVGAKVNYAIPSEIFIIDFVLLVSNAAINPLIQAIVWKKLRNRLCFCLRYKKLCCKNEREEVMQTSSSSSAINPMQTELNFSVEVTNSITKSKAEL